ncbi:hypothetical protein BHE74_00048161 [Ensete ventricosum]|nr:hypothetical protein BHE74_00048161 [Ensete ventricosum]
MPKSTVESRLREKSTVDGRLREKKGRRRRGKEESRRRGEEIPHAVLARTLSPPAGRPRAVLACMSSLPAGCSLAIFLPRGEKDRGDKRRGLSRLRKGGIRMFAADPSHVLEEESGDAEHCDQHLQSQGRKGSRCIATNREGIRAWKWKREKGGRGTGRGDEPEKRGGDTDRRESTAIPSPAVATKSLEMGEANCRAVTRKTAGLTSNCNFLFL